MSVLTSTRTARKTHICSRCGNEIRPGERYGRHSMTPNDAEFGNPHWWTLVTHEYEFCNVEFE